MSAFAPRPLAWTQKRRKGKIKILELLAAKNELNNSDIRETLEISAATITRYMDELERENRENKVKQVGKIGHAVTYRIK